MGETSRDWLWPLRRLSAAGAIMIVSVGFAVPTASAADEPPSSNEAASGGTPAEDVPLVPLEPIPTAPAAPTAPPQSGAPSPPQVGKTAQPPMAAVAVAKRETPWYRWSSYASLGTGALLFGFGVWQGIVAQDAQSDFANAATQRKAMNAKHRGEAAGDRANWLFAFSGVLVAAGVGALALDFLGMFDEAGVAANDPAARTARPSVSLHPISGGAAFELSLTVPSE